MLVVTVTQAQESERLLVPQIELIELNPKQVLYHPDDLERVVIVNHDGSVLVVEDPSGRRPKLRMEVLANAETVGLAVKEGRLRAVAGGRDGTVRLWDLEAGEQIGKTLVEHKGRVNSISISKDGRWAVSAGIDKTVWLWELHDDAMTGTKLGTHEHEVHSVAITPNGDRAVSGDEYGMILLWDLEAAKQDGGPLVGQPLEEHMGRVTSVAIRDGRWAMSMSTDGTVRLWDLENNAPTSSILGEHDDWIGRVAVSEDGRRAVSGGESGKIQLWNLETKRPIGEPLEAHEDEVHSVAISKDGRQAVSGGSDGKVRLWDLGAGVPIGGPIRGGREGPIYSVAIASEGREAMFSGTDGMVRSWDLETDEPIGKRLEGPVGQVRGVAIAPDKSWAVVGDAEGTIWVWDPKADPSVRKPLRGFKHSGRVLSVAISANGHRIVSGGQDGTVRLWDRETNALIEKTLDEGPLWVQSVAITPDGHWAVSGDNNHEVWLWDLRATPPTGKRIGRHDGYIRSVAVDRDGARVISGGENGAIWIWDRGTDAPIGKPLGEHGSEVYGVAITADGRRAVSGGADGTVRLWDLEAGEPAGEPLMGNEGRVYGVAITADGRRAISAGADGMVRLWDPDAGAPIGEPLMGHDGDIPSIAISSDGQLAISVGDDNKVYLWDLEANEATKSFIGHHGSMIVKPRVHGVAITPDGNWAVSGAADHTIRLWDLEVEKLRTEDEEQSTRPLTGHEDEVFSVAIDKDGRWAVSGGKEGAVWLWNLEPDVPLGRMLGRHDDKVSSIAIDKDGYWAVSGGEDGTIRLWDLKAGSSKLSASVCPVRKLLLNAPRITAFCSNRLLLLDFNLKVVGQVFLGDRAALALVNEIGIAAGDGDIGRLARTYQRDNEGISERLTEVFIEFSLARRTLFADQTWTARAWQKAQEVVQQANRVYHEWPLVAKATVWPALITALTWLAALAACVIVPARLCHWMLPQVDARSPLPVGAWVRAITLFQWFADTPRARRAWLHQHRAVLEEALFTNRPPVQMRERYADVVLEGQLAWPRRGAWLLGWVTGSGGTGKSAYAFDFVRRELIGRRDRPLPVLVDEEWEGTLDEHVARLMALPPWEGRGPTPEMIVALGRRGHLLPLVDSLSERSGSKLEDVEGQVTTGAFRHVIVTSRSVPPAKQAWDRATVVKTLPLRPEDVEVFVDKYVTNEVARPLVRNRIAPLLGGATMPSPLFLRFAIEQAREDELVSAERLDLVQRYVEEARRDRVDVDPDDFLRASGIAAIAAFTGHPRQPGGSADDADDAMRPREFDFEFVRARVQDGADAAAFMDAEREQEVEPSQLIHELVRSGVLNRNERNRNLQFAYDPVAEYLAAWRLSLDPDAHQRLRARAKAQSNSELAAALAAVAAA